MPTMPCWSIYLFVLAAGLALAQRLMPPPLSEEDLGIIGPFAEFAEFLVRSGIYLAVVAVASVAYIVHVLARH
jgi:hypothetical protein